MELTLLQASQGKPIYLCLAPLPHLQRDTFNEQYAFRMCLPCHCSYCVGNLDIPGYSLPWEQEAKADGKEWTYAANLATPLDICISASDGASDYGNKFGEPVIHGFTRWVTQKYSVCLMQGRTSGQCTCLNAVVTRASVSTSCC